MQSGGTAPVESNSRRHAKANWRAMETRPEVSDANAEPTSPPNQMTNPDEVEDTIATSKDLPDEDTKANPTKSVDEMTARTTLPSSEDVAGQQKGTIKEKRRHHYHRNKALFLVYANREK